MKLVDTAGIRHALDEAESIGIRKSMEALADADIVLVILDASQPNHAEDDELLKQVENRTALVVLNKIDVCGADAPVRVTTPLRTSAATGAGIAELREEILKRIAGENSTQAEAGFLTNMRQASLVTQSIASLDAAEASTRAQVPHEMILLDLYGALRQLDEITGATTADDILNLIFGSFCIGK